MRSADQVGVVLQRESIGPVGLGATAASARLSQSYCFDAKAGPGPVAVIRMMLMLYRVE
jgi:hypothetical protein